LWTEINDLREAQRDHDRKIMNLEDAVEFLRSAHSMLADDIGALQVLSRQASMAQEQAEWEEENKAETSSAAQRRPAPSRGIEEIARQLGFENNRARRKALRVYI
jgi:hypothetical protein